jgi:hypothetical protein
MMSEKVVWEKHMVTASFRMTLLMSMTDHQIDDQIDHRGPRLEDVSSIACIVATGSGCWLLSVCSCSKTVAPIMVVSPRDKFLRDRKGKLTLSARGRPLPAIDCVGALLLDRNMVAIDGA